MALKSFQIQYSNPTDSIISQLKGNALFTGGDVKVTVITTGQSVDLSQFNETTVVGTLFVEAPQAIATEDDLGNALTLLSEAAGLIPTGWQEIP